MKRMQQKGRDLGSEYVLAYRRDRRHPPVVHRANENPNESEESSIK